MSRERETPDSPALTPVRVRWRRQELLLTDGTYLMGRDNSCHILLEDPRISRRHARITVEGSLVFIEDLGSMNGILVNGTRVRERRALFDGDWITVGGEEMELAIGDVGRHRHRSDTQDELSPLPPSSREEADRRISEPPAAEETTQRTRSLEILANIADQALSAGRTEDAADLLKTTLVDVLQEATDGVQVEDETRSFCVEYALRLNEVTDKPRWLDYAVDLLRITGCGCSPELAQELTAAYRLQPKADLGRLDAWANALLNAEDAEASKSAARAVQIGVDVRRARR
ncbi:MAG: FHA domain-containing protein [Polyangiaceae bacterium]